MPISFFHNCIETTKFVTTFIIYFSYFFFFAGLIIKWFGLSIMLWFQSSEDQQNILKKEKIKNEDPYHINKTEKIFPSHMNNTSCFL